VENEGRRESERKGCTAFQYELQVDVGIRILQAAVHGFTAKGAKYAKMMLP